jgi:hypothetical protein
MRMHVLAKPKKRYMDQSVGVIRAPQLPTESAVVYVRLGAPSAVPGHYDEVDGISVKRASP